MPADLADVTFTGFNNTEQNVCEVTAACSGVSATFTVSVLLPDTGTESDYITVYFELYGDHVHNSDKDGQVHTLSGGGLELWLPEQAYTVNHNSTVWDLLQIVLEDTDIECGNPSGNYIEDMTYNGVTIGEFTNGANSGWMYTLNGIHPLLGVSEQFLKDGDVIVWHYTDDYRLEEGSMGWDETSSSSGSTGNTSGQVVLTAEELQKAAESGEFLTAETDQGSVTLSPDALKTLVETEEDVAISLTENEDGSLTITVTAGNEDVTVPLDVALDVPADSLALAIVGKDGTETVIRKSWVENGVAHATIPAGATVKAAKNAKSFIDVKDGNWFKGAVDFVSAHALFKGVSEDEFAPQSTMTRAMLVTVLYRLEDEPKTSGVSFEDVAAGTWYTDAVAWAAENRIVLGDGTGFNPNGNVTREQIATILYRYVQYLGMETTGQGDMSKFSDGADVSTWAQDAMAWAVKVGLFQGDDAGKLNPQGDATRAEVATLLERLVKFIVK